MCHYPLFGAIAILLNPCFVESVVQSRAVKLLDANNCIYETTKLLEPETNRTDQYVITIAKLSSAAALSDSLLEALDHLTTLKGIDARELNSLDAMAKYPRLKRLAQTWVKERLQSQLLTNSGKTTVSDLIKIVRLNKFDVVVTSSPAVELISVPNGNDQSLLNVIKDACTSHGFEVVVGHRGILIKDASTKE